MNINYSTEDFCSICFEPYTATTKGHDAFRLNCQHAFGRSCIIYWARLCTECPVCRQASFPSGLSGGLNAFRRLANRTIFVVDPEMPLYLGVGLGLAFGLGIGAGFGMSCADAFEVTIPLFCLGVFRGITLGREGLFSYSYFLGACAGLLIISND